MRDFFIRPDLKALGVPERTIRVLEKVALLIEALERLETTEGAITDLDDATDALDEAIEDANLSITSLDTRVDALEAGAPYVSEDDTPAWAAPSGTLARTTFAAFAGQTITNPPTQAEVQAIDDHVKVLSQRLAALITDLRGNGALHE